MTMEWDQEFVLSVCGVLAFLAILLRCNSIILNLMYIPSFDCFFITECFS